MHLAKKWQKYKRFWQSVNMTCLPNPYVDHGLLGLIHIASLSIKQFRISEADGAEVACIQEVNVHF